jgi:HK97 family phage portal protein
LGLRTWWNHQLEWAKRDLAAEQIGWQYRDRFQMSTGSVNVTQETALRSSAVWACLRVRADLISSMPVDVFRQQDGIAVAVPTPPVLRLPGGEHVGIREWMYSTQFDLDRAGNAFGLITERNAAGLPAQIELADLNSCSVIQRPSAPLKYRIYGKEYFPDQVWHEKQYTVGGFPVGLSPIAYAAWSLGGYLSAQQFALDWFSAGAAPTGVLKNTAKQITDDKALAVKTNFKLATQNRDVFVHGNEWEWVPAQQEAIGIGFLDERKFGITDICRYLGVPADIIDAPNEGSSITYASIDQRNLQLFIINLGPAIGRREDALSRLVMQSRFVKLNTKALLRLDDKTQAEILDLQLRNGSRTNTEVRALLDLPPLTPAEVEQFTTLYGKSALATTSAANSSGGEGT